MTDHWGSWPEDQPDFGGPDGGDVGDPPPDHPAAGGYPVETFGPAEPDATAGEEGFGPAETGDDPLGAAGPDDGPPHPIGYGGIDAHVDEPLGPDPYAGGEAGMGPAEPPESPAEAGFGTSAESGPGASAEAGFGAADAPVGADPDLAPYGDAAAWPEPAGPDVANLGPPPEPVDGFPWTDPSVLGDPAAGPLADPTALAPENPGPDELADYAGERLPADGDPWSALAASEDPATSALARFWSPGAD